MNGKGSIRVIVADSQAIFRAGLRKIFALEDDVRVVGQQKPCHRPSLLFKNFSADILIFEAALSSSPADSVSRSAASKCEVRLWSFFRSPIRK